MQHLSRQRCIVDHGSTRMVREDALFVPVLTPREPTARTRPGSSRWCGTSTGHPVTGYKPLTCGAKGTRTLAFWMQTRFFACFYVAGSRLTGRLAAEIVADCRWASPGVWLRWLFVWLFEASFWTRWRDSRRSNLTPTASGQVALTGFPASSDQEIAGQGTDLPTLALDWLFTKAFWLAPPEFTGTPAPRTRRSCPRPQGRPPPATHLVSHPSSYPAARAGMTHRDERNVRRWIKPRISPIIRSCVRLFLAAWLSTYQGVLGR